MKLLTLNIEGLKHFSRVLSLIKKENPDILCLQEVPESFLPKIESYGYHTQFLTRCIKKQDGMFFTDGIAIASKTPFIQQLTYNYFETDAPDDSYDESNQRRRNNHGVLMATTIKNGIPYCIANTHFTWTADGATASPAQVQDMDNMLQFLKKSPQHILCGDLNIPRTYNELYKKLTEQYTDAIPSSFKTSLDAQFHRMRSDPEKQILLDTFMVDYILTTPEYTATSLRQIFGVSDHAATVADISQHN